MHSGLTGRVALQSVDEWQARNRVLADSLAGLVNQYMTVRTDRILDLGCQTGKTTDLLAARVSGRWFGVDPVISDSSRSPAGVELAHGWGHDIPFPDDHFDCVMMNNVLEHVEPSAFDATLLEVKRVLVAGGVLVGQIPNSRFFIESHSRLPLFGWLPRGLQKRAWRFSPAPWEHDFYMLSIRQLVKRAKRTGFTVVVVRNHNYPADAIPRRMRRAAAIARPIMRVWPWSWQFVLRNAEPAST